MDGEVTEIRWTDAFGHPPLTHREMVYFKELVRARSDDIVAKWIDFFVLNKSIKPEQIHKARTLIADGHNDVLVTPTSDWEIAIKISIGKYTLPEPYDVFIQRELASNAFAILPILPTHTAALTEMPFHHRDPFDRLLIAQAMTETVPLISADAHFDAYQVKRLW